jgi:cytochrome c
MTRVSSRFILVLVAVGAFWPKVSWAADAAAGKAVYAKKCQMCHGAEGQGNAGMAKALKTEIKPLGSDEVQNKSDADLKKIIAEGTGKMKAVAGLAAGDADNIVAFVRSLKK